MKWISGSLAVLVLLALVGTAALAAPTYPSGKPAGTSKEMGTRSFQLTGRIVSVKDNDVLIKVTSAPKSLRRYEKNGELDVMLGANTKVLMGKKSISASMLKPNEKVSVSGRFKPSDNPTFEATRVTVLASK